MDIDILLYYFFMGIALLGFLWSASAKRLVYSLLGLLLGLFSISWLLIFSGGETVGIAHIVIYVGGILVLFLFGIFLASRSSTSMDIPSKFRAIGLPILVVVALAAWMLPMVFDLQPFWNSKAVAHFKLSNVHELGKTLMTWGVPGLELMAVLLLLALYGAGYFVMGSRKR